MAYEDRIFDHQNCDYDPCDYHIKIEAKYKELVGKRVDIKLTSDWGIVRAYMNGEFHISIADHPTMTQVFSRNEFTVPRKVSA